MQKRILPLAIIAVSFFSFFNWNCTKLDTTDIGSDLLPAVDNVHTFADTLQIDASQFTFNDTTKVLRTRDFVLGAINNDPLFGTTKAAIYFQLKPRFYPFYYGNAKDTVNALDSVVLCLKYRGFWGDSSLPVQLNVHEVDDLQFRDSIKKTHTVNYSPTIGTMLASASVDIRRLADTVKYANRRDYSVGLIRIKMPQWWVQQLFMKDSVKANASSNAFYSDSTFRSFYKGLAVIPTGGASNSLMYVNLADTTTKLEIHFKRKNGGPVDTTYQTFVLNPSFVPTNSAQPATSSVANHIERNRNGSIASPAPGELYLQTTPGTYVNLNIPALSSLSNRIIHRAEIIVQQIPHNSVLDEKLGAPFYLYIDIKDTTSGADKWKPVYFDLNPNQFYDPDSKTGFDYLPQTIDFGSFGGFRRETTDKFGNRIKYYNFNVSRYVQQIVTRRTPNYTLRLYAPYEIYYPQLGNSIQQLNNLAEGRVKVGAGNNTNYRMTLRIVYSKL